MTRFTVPKTSFLLALLVGVACYARADFPPLSVEISDLHPLFIFSCPDGTGATPEGYAAGVTQQWDALDEELRPYAVLRVRSQAPREGRTAWYGALAPLLQTAGIPVVMAVGEDDPRSWMSADEVERLLLANTAIRGIEISDLRFDTYVPSLPGGDGMTPKVRWLTGMIDVAARYGRFTHLPLGGINWPRVMANTDCTALYKKLVACRTHVIPSGLYRGAHALARNGALLGLWLEGAVTQWGITADADWYGEARFMEPGVFGLTGGPEKTPSSLYRAMILTGVMAGASVYAFDNPDSLWMGAQRRHWDEAIRPTLTSVLRLGLIPRQDFVRKKVSVVYQLGPAGTPPEFHANLRDIDAILDEGNLIRGAYGLERPGQVWELIPNRGDYYLVPLLSPHADDAVLKGFARVVHPGEMNGPADWKALLGRYRDLTQAGEGSAFVTRVGRGVFVLNTRENAAQEQTFAIDALPAPVRHVEARRLGESVALTWPFREGDVSYSVYRRAHPDERFVLIASGLDDRQYVDTNVFPAASQAPEPVKEAAPPATRPVMLEAAIPDDTAPEESAVAYAVTALTSEQEPFSGTVGYGEYLALSVVESRIAEQVVLHPLIISAVSEPIPETVEASEAAPVDPRFAGVPDGQLAAAKAIVARIDQWDRAFSGEDLSGVMDLYATSYEDPQGWRSQYVRRAYQWFFERYTFPRMERQVRRWQFSRTAETGAVNLLLYCRLTGVAISSADGRQADPQVAIPRTSTCEVWVTWAREEGLWRIVKTNPALPNFRDLLSYAAGPYDNFPLGADWLE